MPMLTANVPEELMKQLNEAAEVHAERTAMPLGARSAIVRLALRDYLDRFFVADRSANGTEVHTTDRAAKPAA